MSDPLRTDLSRAIDGLSDADRDGKIEQLLLAGLDHYFAGEYQQAINVWTRTLFLDRNHARARAYIERARTALAERQREADELLQKAIAAFGRGEPNEARQLVEEAIRAGAPIEDALALIQRLDRLGTAPQVATPAQAGRTRRDQAPDPAAAPPASKRRITLWLAVAGVAAAIVVVIATTKSTWGMFLDGAAAIDAAPAPGSPAAEQALPLPRRGEIALGRARQLASAGHLRDALALLDQVRTTDPERADADRLRADIQRQLLALARIDASRPDSGQRQP
jgi:tetratricopeptide (TPR) repeat protein